MELDITESASHVDQIAKAAEPRPLQVVTTETQVEKDTTIQHITVFTQTR